MSFCHYRNISYCSISSYPNIFESHLFASFRARIKKLQQFQSFRVEATSLMNGNEKKGIRKQQETLRIFLRANEMETNGHGTLSKTLSF